jgi:CDP-diglyceride synthetase
MKSKKQNSLVRSSKSEPKHLPREIIFPKFYQIIKIYITKQMKIATTLWYFYIFKHIRIVWCGYYTCFKNDLYTITGFEYINTPVWTNISTMWPTAPVAQWIEQWIPNPKSSKLESQWFQVIIWFHWLFLCPTSWEILGFFRENEARRAHF